MFFCEETIRWTYQTGHVEASAKHSELTAGDSAPETTMVSIPVEKKTISSGARLRGRSRGALELILVLMISNLGEPSYLEQRKER